MQPGLAAVFAAMVVVRVGMLSRHDEWHREWQAHRIEAMHAKKLHVFLDTVLPQLVRTAILLKASPVGAFEHQLEAGVVAVDRLLRRLDPNLPKLGAHSERHGKVVTDGKDTVGKDDEEVQRRATRSTPHANAATKKHVVNAASMS
eukprot:6237989-Prymnesium_polylepis.1